LTRLVADPNPTSAFLDDYAHVIQALIKLYTADFSEKWLFRAKELTQYAIQHFHDDQSSLLFYTLDTDQLLIIRQRKITDSVIPSSNAVMAHNLFLLGHYFQKEEWMERTNAMLTRVRESMISRPLYSGHWLSVLLKTVFPFWQIVISGEAFPRKISFMQKQFLPNAIFSGSNGRSTLPIAQDKKSTPRSPIYLCRDQTCLQPIENAEEALEVIRKEDEKNWQWIHME
jgi:uncharacterized protein YyaL (SSP411 family)